MVTPRGAVLGSLVLGLLVLAGCAGGPVVPPPDRTPLATSLPGTAPIAALPPATATPSPTRTPENGLVGALGPLGLSELASQFNTPQPLLAPPSTPVPAATSTPATPAATATAARGALPLATAQPPDGILAPTPVPSLAGRATIIPSPILPALAPTAAIAANIRSGPGLDFRIVGSVPAGNRLEVVATNADRTWFRLADGNWIFATLVANPPRALQVINTPAP